MQILGLRFCRITDHADEVIAFFDKLGLPRLDGCDFGDSGAIFPAGNSWLEIWQQSEHMPAGFMLQILVDDADAFAAQAKEQGLSPQGPMDEHGERIYFLQPPGGFALSFQSKLQ